MTHNQFCVDTDSILCTCDRERYIKTLERELAEARKENEGYKEQLRHLSDETLPIKQGKMIMSLQADRDRWKGKAKNLVEKLENLTRDSLICDFNGHWDSYKQAKEALAAYEASSENRGGNLMIEINHNPEFTLRVITNLFWGMPYDEFKPMGQQLYAQLMGWA